MIAVRKDPTTVRESGMKRIILTGGGTAGHVTPNLALVPYLKKEGYEVLRGD